MWPHTTELLLVLAIAVFLFGAGRIPRLAEDIGKSIKAFKSGLKDDDKKAEKKEDNKESQE